MTIPRVILIVLALALTGPGAAAAASSQPAWPDSDRLARDMGEAGELLRQGLEKMLGSIDAALRAMPQYELPTIDADGNIIIRRKPPGARYTDPDTRRRSI
jgi:hypothetical protein